jgi:hypothetical protein
MREELLKQLVEKTFASIANPLQGNGVYAEIQKAVIAAYNIGKRQDMVLPDELLTAGLSNS